MGLFIAIEGGDGSGKGTQSSKLEQYLREEGCDVLKLSFPRYGEASSKIITKYLNGHYGDVNDNHPDLTSLPFTIDRFGAKAEIEEHLSKRDSVVIADRYVASNLAHQGTKLKALEERREFYEDIMEIEYKILGLPKPDLNIVLIVPTALAQSNVDKKEARSYTESKRDIHESDTEHLERAKSNYEELCRLFPDEFEAIDCMELGKLRTIDSVYQDIKNVVQLKLSAL